MKWFQLNGLMAQTQAPSSSLTIKTLEQCVKYVHGV